MALKTRSTQGVKTLTVQLLLSESDALDKATAELKRSAPGVVRAKSDVVRLLLQEHSLKKLVAFYAHETHGFPRS